MTSHLSFLMALANDVEQFELGECGPSDDPDKQTAYLYAFKDVAKRFVSAARRIDDADVKEELARLDLNPEFITEAYDLRADLIPIIDLVRQKSSDPSWGQRRHASNDALIDLALVERLESLGGA